MKPLIPVMHCFDDRYVIPAAVAFRSLLEQADPRFLYRLHVLHSDVTPEHQAALQETVAPFADRCEIQFHDMQGRFTDLFDRLTIQGHYSKEVLYKLVAPSMFPDYARLIVSDVDVVYLDDIAPTFDAIGEGHWIAGVPGVDMPAAHWDAYRPDFTEQEIAALRIGGGYLVMDLEALRREGVEARLCEYGAANAHRLRQAEQDILNLCCQGRISHLPLRTMVCNYFYDMFRDPAALDRDRLHGRAELEAALAHPIQLHYATRVKPWNDPGSTRADAWWQVLARTPLLGRALEALARRLRLAEAKKGVTLRLPISRRKSLYLEVGREKRTPSG
jgi:lipopolysaccharide biosynthesis glycosyltransferase